MPIYTYIHKYKYTILPTFITQMAAYYTGYPVFNFTYIQEFLVTTHKERVYIL